jgi:hypothetical protein
MTNRSQTDSKLKAVGFTPNDVVAGSADASGGITLVINK